MSYILDALKKAEAERKLGDLPELYAPSHVSTAMPMRSATWLRILLWGGLMVGTAAAVALMLVRPWSAPPLTLSAPAAAAPPTFKAVPAPPPPPIRETPRSRPAAVEKKAPAPAEKKPENMPKLEAAKPDTKLPTLRELPADIQREIPALSTNGYLYSSNQADRTVLLNQKLRHEGEQVAPDLVLEQLTPNGMVLNYKGTRFRTSY